MDFSRPAQQRLALFVVMVFAGPIFTFGGIGDFFTAARTNGWPTVEGRVIGARVKVSETKARFKTTVSYKPDVTYEYTVNGSRFTANQLTVTDASYSSAEDAEAAILKIVERENVKVHYDAKDPSKAVLQTGTTFGTWMKFLLGLGCTAVAFFMGRSYFREVSSTPLKAPTSGF